LQTRNDFSGQAGLPIEPRGFEGVSSRRDAAGAKQFVGEVQEEKMSLQQDESLSRIESWDELFLEMCFLISRKSKDPSTRTGCVVVDGNNRIRSMGFNGFPQGVGDEPERYADRELKYRLIAHCDENAIFSAARIGIPLDGCTMYLTGPPCSNCTKGIIQAGIRRVVWPRWNKFEDDVSTRERWRTSLQSAELMAHEAGVLFERVE
jgi:dCMP deaminase